MTTDYDLIRMHYAGALKLLEIASVYVPEEERESITRAFEDARIYYSYRWKRVANRLMIDPPNGERLPLKSETPGKQRRHKFVLDVSFDRPIEGKRAGSLLEDGINHSITALGRDLTRPNSPAVRLIRADVKNLGRVLAAHKRLADRQGATK